MVGRPTVHATLGGRGNLLVPATVVVIGVLAVVAYIVTYAHYLDMSMYPPVRSDGVGYYAYLPGWLIDHDPSLRHVVSVDLAGQRLDAFGLTLQPASGNYGDRYPIGEAVLIIPFFLLGHVAAALLGVHADGFSRPEELSAAFAGVTYMIVGLALLARSLRRHFSPGVTAATLVGVTFGSDLFHYGTFDSMFSHAFSFFLVALLLETSRYFHRHPRAVLPALALGANLGMIVLVRSSNGLFVLVPLLHGIGTDTSPRARLLWMREHAGRLTLVGTTMVAALVPQMVVWKIATGHWISTAYDGFGFDFTHPRVFSALFSLNPHGFLPWAPIMALAIAGIPWMRRFAPDLLLPCCAVLLVSTFLIASWSSAAGGEWFFGGGYGDRAFVDLFPVLAFGLASLLTRFATGSAHRALAATTVACCLLATLQMLHYWRLIVPFNGVSIRDYLRLLPRGVW